jgi:predicted kinase
MAEPLPLPLKAIVTVGLPASGKSTYAAGLKGDYVELNMDDLRFEICGDPTNQEVTHRAFGRRRRKLWELARQGRNVIISDTHAKRRDRKRTIRELKELGYEVELVFFNVGEQTCLKRNEARDRHVPVEVIARMAERIRHTPPTPHEADRFRVITEPDDPLLSNEHAIFPS